MATCRWPTNASKIACWCKINAKEGRSVVVPRVSGAEYLWREVSTVSNDNFIFFLLFPHVCALIVAFNKKKTTRGITGWLEYRKIVCEQTARVSLTELLARFRIVQKIKRVSDIKVVENSWSIAKRRWVSTMGKSSGAVL